MALHLNASFVQDVIGRYQTPSAVQQPNRLATNQIVVHHAAWIYTPGDACRSIFSYHASQWPKYGRIGYHEVIQVETDDSLVCYQVNPPEMIGAGVWGRNGDCFHICAATHFRNDIPAQVWQDALALRVAAAKQRYPRAKIVGHKEIALPGHGTDCPGGRWAEWKPGLLEAVVRLSHPAPTAPGTYYVRGVAVHEGPALTYPIALGGTAFLPSGSTIDIDEIKPDGWGHLRDGRGFVLLEQLSRM